VSKYEERKTIARTTFFSTFFDETKEGKKKLSIRAKRWMAVISLHLLFFLSFKIDIQIKERQFDNRVRHFFWAIFLILSFTSSYLVFELINIVGILSRFVAYGWSAALSWVGAVFIIEVFFARRAWCKYLCPIGTTYGYLGAVSAVRVEWNDNCDHCMVCHDVCFENQVLELTKSKYDRQREELGIKKELVSGLDCTLCGRCIDVCHADALNYTFRLKSLV